MQLLAEFFQSWTHEIRAECLRYNVDSHRLEKTPFTKECLSRKYGQSNYCIFVAPDSFLFFHGGYFYTNFLTPNCLLLFTPIILLFLQQKFYFFYSKFLSSFYTKLFTVFTLKILLFFTAKILLFLKQKLYFLTPIFLLLFTPRFLLFLHQ